MNNYTFALPTVTAKSRKVRFKKGPSFDWAKGEFRVNGAGELLEANSKDAFRDWCLKSLNIERFSKFAYSTGEGIETQPLALYHDRDAKESWMRRTIEETLMADPMGRTMEVTDFRFDYPAPDAMEVHFTVVGQDGNRFELTKAVDIGNA